MLQFECEMSLAGWSLVGSTVLDVIELTDTGRSVIGGVSGIWIFLLASSARM